MYMALYLAFFHLAPRLKQLPHVSLSTFTAVCSVVATIVFREKTKVEFGSVSMAALWILLLLSAILVISAYYAEANGVMKPPNWAALVGIYGVAQLSVAMFYYSQKSLEDGTLSITETPLEVTVSCLLPMLLFTIAYRLCGIPALANPRNCLTYMLKMFLDKAGQVALLTYLLHYFFSPFVRTLLAKMIDYAQSPKPDEPLFLLGVFQLACVIALPLGFTMICILLQVSIVKCYTLCCGKPGNTPAISRDATQSYDGLKEHDEEKAKLLG
jgi:drug/metabolite transporter (DMT)-like permease